MKNSAHIRRFIDPIAGFRATFVDVREPLLEMQAIQNFMPASAILVGRAVSGAALLAAHLDDGEIISLYFRGKGPMEYIFAECSKEGDLRGYTAHPEVLPAVNGEIDLKAALGEGTLTVVRTHPQKPTPTKGMISLVTGLIGEDVAHYLQQSEQRRALVSLGVKLKPDGKFAGAGGIFIEMLPGAPNEFAELLEENFKNSHPLSEKLATLVGHEHMAEEVMAEYLGGFKVRELEAPTPLRFHCPCSQDRLIRSMRMFSKAELNEIIEKKEITKAKCEFCGRHYELDWVVVKDIRDGRHKKGMH